MQPRIRTCPYGQRGEMGHWIHCETPKHSNCNTHDLARPVRIGYLVSTLACSPTVVHEVLTTPKHKFQFLTPESWSTGKMYVGHHKWDIKVLLIANPRGNTMHFAPNRMQLTKLSGWTTPPTVNSMDKTMQIKNYNAVVAAASTFHIPSKLMMIVGFTTLLFPTRSPQLRGPTLHVSVSGQGTHSA
jgi:hypothetical protein